MKSGHHPLDRLTVRRFALLMQIHVLTDARRVAARHGVSAEYVRRQWRDLQAPDNDAMWRRLECLLAECMRDAQHSRRARGIELRQTAEV